jgi:sodium/bile acid cotransporter 7
VLISGVLLALALVVVQLGGRALKLPAGEVTAARYCGATKSLASGVPIAAVLFAGQPVSIILLPIMIYHQLQLVVCAILAQRTANAAMPAGASPAFSSAR